MIGTGQSWVYLQWNNPSFVNDPTFSRLEITTLHSSENSGTTLTVQPVDGLTDSFNVTSLEPSGSFEFTVAVVSDTGSMSARSLPSERVYFSGKFVVNEVS